MSLKPRGVKACIPKAPMPVRHDAPASACGGVLAAGNGIAADGLWGNRASHAGGGGTYVSLTTMQASSIAGAQAGTRLADRGVAMPSRVLAALRRRAMRSRESVTSCSLLAQACPMASWMPASGCSDLGGGADTNSSRIDNEHSDKSRD